VLTYETRTAAPAAAVWRLMAEPARWRRWAPHVRGAWGLGDPEVQVGRLGLVRLLGAPVVPARITRKRSGRMWVWKVGPVELTHRVDPSPEGGSTVAVDIDAPASLERVLSASYGPLVQVLVRRLGQVAERSQPVPTAGPYATPPAPGTIGR
jgi:hypothetical protein